MNECRRYCIAFVLSAAYLPAAGTAQVRVDERLPDYRPQTKVAGPIVSIGSDTLNNLMTLWLEELSKHHAAIRPEIRGKGSSTAYRGLMEEQANLGLISREFRDDEIAAFREKFGGPPVVAAVAFDALAVFVHKDNPIESLSLAQLDAIFSKTRRLGHGEDITTWGQLGMGGKYKDAPITLFGRNSASGTYGFFKTIALAKGDFKETLREQQGTATLVQAVSEDPFAIGFGGVGYTTDGVRAVPLVVDPNAKDAENRKPVSPTAENIISGKYPLARKLSIAIRPLPADGLEPARREFFRLVYSRQGQEIVVKDGYLPLPFDVAAKEANRVGMELQSANRRRPPRDTE